MSSAEAPGDQIRTEHGRVDAEGTVYVNTGGSERAVGQWPGGDPQAAMDFYVKRFTNLEVEVDLLEQRLRAKAMSPDEAVASLGKMRGSVENAPAVGDLDGLLARVDQLDDIVQQLRAERRAERAARTEQSRAAKQEIVQEAERIARGSDWRGGPEKLRGLLEQWKALARLDKPSDDELWKRFSAARTAYTKRRRQHVLELNARREGARQAKERIVEEAESLSASTEWGATTRAYRELMQRWKDAGSARRDVEDNLWKRFRAAQDTFFTARDAANSEIDKRYAENADIKRTLLAEAEKLLPVTDPKAAREAFRRLAHRWDAAGKVPRADMRDLEDRFKKIDQAIRSADDDRWRRSNPEALARASAAVSQLEATLESLRSKLSLAESANDERTARQLRADIEARQSWLAEARKSLVEFGG